MKIVIVGAGNLATHISQALLNAGHDVLQVYSRTYDSASLLASKLGCKAVTRIGDIATDADLYVVSVTDSALEGLLPSLCARRPEGVFVHTAGSMPLSVFDGLATRYGVIYPMQTFSKYREVDFHVIPCFIEASDETTLRLLHMVCGGISSMVYELASEKRKYLHLAAVFACNFANHCYDVASRLLEENGLDFAAMLPLIDETASKIHDMNPADAQTGPAVRFDRNVMDKHMQLLDGKPQLRQMYKMMSEGIHELKNKA